MAFHYCLSGSPFRSLQLPPVAPSSSARLVFRTADRIPVNPHSYLLKLPSQHLTIALSTSAAVQTSPATLSSTTNNTPNDKGDSFFFLLLFFFFFSISFLAGKLKYEILLLMLGYCRWESSVEGSYRLQVDKG